MCGGKTHAWDCPAGPSPQIDSSSRPIGTIIVREDGSLDVRVEDDHYDFEIDADSARKLAEAILAKQRA